MKRQQELAEVRHSSRRKSHHVVTLTSAVLVSLIVIWILYAYSILSQMDEFEAFIANTVGQSVSLSSKHKRTTTAKSSIRSKTSIASFGPNNNASSPTSPSHLKLCELPSCEIVRRSRLYSERCATNKQEWPLLITATPRSGTVSITRSLQSHGMDIQNDWGPHRRHGRVSWIHAFCDAEYGPKVTRSNHTFAHVLHQLRDPVEGITSMCTEPVHYLSNSFLMNHINITIFDETDHLRTSRMVLEWWVGWQTFLAELKLPSYQIEGIQVKDIFRITGLERVYRSHQKRVPPVKNKRDHRTAFSWQELFTIDPHLSVKAWKLAHYFGYEYPDVEFDRLTCLPKLPLCNVDGNDGTVQEEESAPSASCSVGTHPVPMIGNLSASPVENGWISWGCVEFKTRNGTFIGLDGVRGEGNEGITDEVIAQLSPVQLDKKP